MKLTEMTPYINGVKFTRECKEPVRCTPEILNRAMIALASTGNSDKILSACDLAKDFYNLLPDLTDIVPRSEREEIFYALKNSGYSPVVPAKCIYVFSYLYNKYGSINLALKALSTAVFNVFFQKGYLGEGYTMRDVFCTMFDKEYEPFTQSKLRIKHATFDEVYVISTDMVALLPKDISDGLTDRDLESIALSPSGLHIDGMLLRCMANHYGAVVSTYDLRNVI